MWIFWLRDPCIHTCTHTHAHRGIHTPKTHTHEKRCYKLHVCSLKDRLDHPKALEDVETLREIWVPCSGFAALVPQEVLPIPLKSPPVSCCCALVVHSTLHRPSLCSVSSLAHRSHIPSPHCHCKNCCCTPLQPTNVLVDYALFARSRKRQM